jgi:hypothetical protein
MVKQYVEPLGTESAGWEIDILDKGTALQPSFTDRLGYLDKCLARGILVPERSILEGRYGTRADAQSHADAGLMIAEQTYPYVTD